MPVTPHLGLVLLEQAQAQKEITVNTALMRIDALLNSSAIDKDLAVPPSSPLEGDVYILPNSPSGAWSGHGKELAYFEQIWRFILPRKGLTLWVQDESLHYVFNGSSWVATTGSPSDYRLKSDYRAVENPVERVLALKPRNFTWKDSGERADGFIAHEVQQIVPAAVAGGKDGEAMQMLDAVRLIPLLTAALQEALRRVEKLEVHCTYSH